jgi:hypothetical protein
MIESRSGRRVPLEVGMDLLRQKREDRGESKLRQAKSRRVPERAARPPDATRVRGHSRPSALLTIRWTIARMASPGTS